VASKSKRFISIFSAVVQIEDESGMLIGGIFTSLASPAAAEDDTNYEIPDE
jgi:hypothetical protein